MERKNGVFQDRLEKELRFLVIKTIEETNLMLGSFTDKLNGKFLKKPADEKDYHMPVPESIYLDEDFCIDNTRKILNEWTISHEGITYQINRQSDLPPARKRVIVFRELDGSIQILYANQFLDFKEIKEREPALKVKTIKNPARHGSLLLTILGAAALKTGTSWPARPVGLFSWPLHPEPKNKKPRPNQNQN